MGDYCVLLSNKWTWLIKKQTPIPGWRALCILEQQVDLVNKTNAYSRWRLWLAPEQQADRVNKSKRLFPDGERCVPV